MRAILAAALVALGVSPAHAVFYAYPEWQRLEPSARAAYVAGMFDSYLSFSAGYADAAKHFADCLAQRKLSSKQMADNMAAFAATRADIQSRPVPAVMLNYLIELCGAVPPGPPAK